MSRGKFMSESPNLKATHCGSCELCLGFLCLRTTGEIKVTGYRCSAFDEVPKESNCYTVNDVRIKGLILTSEEKRK